MGVFAKASTGCIGFLFCLAFLFCLMLMSCGGSSKPAAAGDFTLTATPSTVALVQSGTGQQVSVSATATNGFAGTVTVAITGLPNGVIAQPATLILTPGTAQTVTITATGNAATGNATLTLTGTSGALSHTATVMATIAAPSPDFTLSALPAALTVVSGGGGSQVSVTAAAVNGFTGTVAVAASGLPAGVTAQPATFTLVAGGTQNVTINSAAGIAAGTATLTFVGTSGALSHTATAAVAIMSPPDFTLAVTPGSVTIVGGAAGSPVSVLATAVNSFSGTVAVTITGLPAGVTANPATLNLATGVAQSTTLTAALTAAAGVTNVTFTGTSASLSHSVPLALTVQAAPMTNAPDVTTYHYDMARDGLNAKETILTPSNVNATQFGKIGFDTVDGKVDGQPLYLANVIVGNQFRNVLYVVTEHDSVYAFDADSGAQIWKTSILGSGETTSDNHGCSQITPEIGITSTPVIDRKQGPNGTLFTVGMTKDAGGKYHQRLHALDVMTGAEISGSPREVAATYPETGANSQNGNVVFDPSQYAERASLLLLNGNIYTGWTSHCDVGAYTGWVIGYSESTLQQTQVLNLTPNGTEGSIWMSGGGIAADSSGFIYILQANGTFDTTLDINGFPTLGDYGNAMVKLSTSGKLAVADYFEMYNGVSESSEDLDLGSGGPLLLPDQVDANGIVHHLIVGAGKDKNIYLADRDNLGKFNPATAPFDSNIYQQLTGAMAGLVYSSPAYFNGVIYLAADGDHLKAFPIMPNAQMAASPSSVSPTAFGHPGATPTISANGSQNGIVWALDSDTGGPGILHAYDPTNLQHELYNSTQAASSRDSFGTGNKFITPMVVNGKVYVGTQTGVAVFGLLPH